MTTLHAPPEVGGELDLGMNLVILQGRIKWVTRYESGFARLSLAVNSPDKQSMLSVVLRQALVRDVLRQCRQNGQRKDLKEELQGRQISVIGYLDSCIEHGRQKIDVTALKVELMNEADCHHNDRSTGVGDRVAWRGI
ncbi:MAG: hypothetical protein JW850_12925 [Thermoflexales bacterium]|nr:hypothetical protein [Thermoflexales bacterium]